MSWETFNEEGFRMLHDVQSFRGVRNPARSQNARFSLAHRLAATFSGTRNGMSAIAAHFVGRRIARRSEAGQYLDRRHQRSRATIPSHTATARTITPTVVRNSTTRRRL